MSTPILKPGVDTGNKTVKITLKNAYARGWLGIERSGESGCQGPARGKTTEKEEKSQMYQYRCKDGSKARHITVEWIDENDFKACCKGLLLWNLGQDKNSCVRSWVCCLSGERIFVPGRLLSPRTFALSLDVCTQGGQRPRTNILHSFKPTYLHGKDSGRLPVLISLT